MYADRYSGGHRFSPGGLAIAIGVNAAVVAALMVAAPLVTHKPPVDPAIPIYQVPLDEPPPPDPLPREAKPSPASVPKVIAPLPPIPLPPTDTWRVDPAPPTPLPIPSYTIPGGTGAGTEPAEAARAAPVIVGPAVDPRYADQFQPPYPPAEQRAGENGRVTVRVLIGTDGRVKQVERVDATSDAFFRVTEQQALRRWRFRPGTRDGVAEATWRTMTVTFVMTD